MSVPPELIAAAKDSGPPLFQAASSAVTSAFNVHESRQNRRFQRDMSNTSHQREVKDLRAAGLNPILSAKYGGSSTPPGSAANLQTPDIAGAYNQSRQASTGKQLADQQGKLIEAQIRDVNSGAALKDAQAKALGETTPVGIEKTKNEIKNLIADNKLKKSQGDEILKRIDHYNAQISNLNAQTQTESVKLAKEKALQVLYKALEQLLKYADKKIRDKVLTNAPSFLDYNPFEYRHNQRKSPTSALDSRDSMLEKRFPKRR